MKKKLFTVAFIAFGLNAFGQVTNGLIAKYSFSGNANDDVGTHNGTVFGATLTTDRFGNDSAAYQFDRDSSQYIDVPYSPDFTPGLNPLSISVWFLSPSNDSLGGSIIDWYRCGAYAACGLPDAALYNIALGDSSRIYFDVRDDNGVDSSYFSTQKYNDNTWHHAVLIFNPANDFVEYYLDNVLLDSVAESIGSLTDAGIQIPFEIGRVFRTGWGLPTAYYNGKIDDIRIYGRTLSVLEVDSLFHLPSNTGISSTEPEFYFSVFPNPSNNLLNILNNSNQILRFTLYNSLGEKIIDKTLMDKKNTIDLSASTSGIYFYNLTSDKNLIKTGKLIKQ